MVIAYHVAKALSITLFCYYGVQCIFANGMAMEFERFGLARFRRLTGSLELLGAIGLALGYLLPFLTLLSAGGLGLLMLLGVAVRVRVGDSLVETLPAAFLLSVNVFVLVQAAQG